MYLIFALTHSPQSQSEKKMSTDTTKKWGKMRLYIEITFNANQMVTNKKKRREEHRIILHASTLTVFSQSLMLIIKASLYVTKFVKMRSVCVCRARCMNKHTAMEYVLKMAVYWISLFYGPGERERERENEREG